MGATSGPVSRSGHAQIVAQKIDESGSLVARESLKTLLQQADTLARNLTQLRRAAAEVVLAAADFQTDEVQHAIEALRKELSE